MKRTFLSLVPLALFASPAAAQVPDDFDLPFDPAVMALVDNGVGTRDISPSLRGDRSSCEGTDDAGILRAVDHCWPVLESWRLHSALLPMFDAWESLPDEEFANDTPQRRALIDSAEKIIAHAGNRAYPAQDVPLMAAYMARGAAVLVRGDFSAAIADLTAARDVVASSRLEAFRTSRFRDDLGALIESITPPPAYPAP